MSAVVAEKILWLDALIGVILIEVSPVLTHVDANQCYPVLGLPIVWDKVEGAFHRSNISGLAGLYLDGGQIPNQEVRRDST